MPESTVPAPAAPLDPIDRQIIAVLQVRPRASWSTIAQVLGVPDRSVARRGNELIESGRAAVVGVTGPSRTALAFIRTAPNSTRSVLAGIAGRADCVFAYALTGDWQIVAEHRVDDSELAALVLDELPTVAGVARMSLARVTRVYRSVREWIPDVLTADQRSALGGPPGQRPRVVPESPVAATVVSVEPDITDADRALLRLLAEDGRTPAAQLAARARLSENTVRRRLGWLETHHYSRLRVVVEPAALGFPSEAIVRVSAPPRLAGELIAALLTHSEVRYLAALGSDADLLVHLACRNNEHLHDLVSRSPWCALAHTIEVDHLLVAEKRSGRLRRADRRGRGLY